MPILQAFSRWPKPRRILATVALLALVACLAYLVIGPKPWVAGMASAPLDESGQPTYETSHFRVSGLWWGAVANSVLCVLALALSRWLTRPLADPKRVNYHFTIEGSGDAKPPPRARLWILGAVLVSMLITLTGTMASNTT